MSLRSIYLYENVSLLLQVAARWLDDSPDSQVILFVISIHIFGGTCYFMTATRKHPAIHCLYSLPPPPANHIHPFTHSQKVGFHVICECSDCKEPSGFNLDGPNVAFWLNAVRNVTENHIWIFWYPKWQFFIGQAAIESLISLLMLRQFNCRYEQRTRLDDWN